MIKLKNIKNTVAYVDAAEYNASHDAINSTPHATNAATTPDAENNKSVRQLLDGQEHPVEKGDTIKKGFYSKADFEWCLAYRYGLSYLSVCTRYASDIITSCTFLKLLPIYNNAMLGATQFMVYFWEIHFNLNKALYINFQKHASVFRKEMLIKINGGGKGRSYVLPSRVCAPKNNDFPM